jgi:phage terminase small subunit
MPALANARHERFAVEVASGKSADAAYAEAGYSPSRKNASRLRANEDVSARIDELLSRVAEVAVVDAAYVLKQAVKLHERCMQEIEPWLDRRGAQVRDEQGNPLYVFNAAGAAKALELVGKHVSVQAFKDKIEHTGGIAITISPDDAAL